MRWWRSPLVLCSLIAVLLAALGRGNERRPPREGFVAVPGGRVWYRVVGNGAGTPLLLIHGGPGGLSCWHEPLTALGDDRPVIFYDQLGSGHSDHPQDTSLWTLPRFVEEVAAVRRALGLRRVMILGHSWGGAVALEYMLTAHPQGVEALVLAGPLVDTPRWIADADTLRQQLPIPVRRTLSAFEAAGKTDAPEYLAAADSFYARYLYHQSWPPAKQPACRGLEFNEQVYRQMWGPTEFRASGSLRDYDRSDRLGELSLPVLFIAGEFDEARPATMREFQRHTPNSQIEIVEGAGHMAMIDRPEAYVAALREFLRKADSAK